MSNASPVSEGDLKPEGNLTFELKQAAMVTVAFWLSASKQILDDWGLLQTYLDTRMRYGLALAEEEQLLKGSGVGNNLNGLLTQATAYSPSGGTKLDVLRQAIVQLEETEYQATGIVLHPRDFQEISSIKGSDGHYVFGAPTSATQRQLWGVPVVTTTAMSSESFLVLDANQAGVVLDRQEARVEISTETGDSFIRNMIVIRCESRLGLIVWRPGALIKGAFGS